MTLQKEDFRGLNWVEKHFTKVPRWTIEPDLSLIKQALETLQHPEPIEVKFSTQDTFNKIYNVKIGSTDFILRVSLPVDPFYKTASEIATVEWIRRTTTLPVPEVIGSSSSRNSPVGFEWILTTKLGGNPFRESWRIVSLRAKTILVNQLAEYSACSIRKQLQGIGNIYPEHAVSSESKPTVDRIVSMEFFWENRIHQSVPRGPFKSSRDWINTRLLIAEKECHEILEKYPQGAEDSDGEDDIEDATRSLKIINKLKPIVSLIFPIEETNEPEPTMLFHDDLTENNILVDQNGKLSGIPDWECVAAVPLWKACSFPAFLQTLPRPTKPMMKHYQPQDADEPSELYWEHLWEYEATVLRDVFLEEMKSLEPAWVKVYESSQRQRDLDLAVLSCTNEFMAWKIFEWIEAIELGKEEVTSLSEGTVWL